MAKWKEVVGIMERMEDFITLNVQFFHIFGYLLEIPQ